MITYKCPKCALPLSNASQCKTFRCENNHCYDAAKEGYVNLHLVEKKKSKHPGDDVDMIKSRQLFLNSGLYACLAEAIVDRVKQINVIENIIDIGCGEGYYSDYFVKKLEMPTEVNVCGIDISKAGVRLAAKRKFGAQLAVASAYDIPYFDNVFDLAVSIFSPLCITESKRILKNNGYLVMVGPGPEHLKGLASKVYNTHKPHKGNFDAVAGDEQFTLLETERVESAIEVEHQLIPHLLRMTPYYWQATAEQQQELSNIKVLSTPVQFDINLYQCVK